MRPKEFYVSHIFKKYNLTLILKIIHLKIFYFLTIFFMVKIFTKHPMVKFCCYFEFLLINVLFHEQDIELYIIYY